MIPYRCSGTAYLSRNVGNYRYALRNIPEEHTFEMVDELKVPSQNWRVVSATVSKGLSCHVVPDGLMGSENQNVTSESRHSAGCIITAASAEMATGSFLCQEGGGEIDTNM